VDGPFGDKVPQYLTNRNGTYTAVRVRYCNQSSSRQDRRHCQTSLALRKQVQQPDKVLDQGLGDTRRPCITKVLDPEARGGLVLCRSGNSVMLVSRFFPRAPPRARKPSQLVGRNHGAAEKVGSHWDMAKRAICRAWVSSNEGRPAVSAAGWTAAPAPRIAQTEGWQVGWTPWRVDTLRPQVVQHIRRWSRNHCAGTCPCSVPARWESTWEINVVLLVQSGARVGSELGYPGTGQYRRSDEPTASTAMVSGEAELSHRRCPFRSPPFGVPGTRGPGLAASPTRQLPQRAGHGRGNHAAMS
jgi:hypothetical protein